MKFAIVVFPGIELRSRRLSRDHARDRPAGRVPIWHKDTDLRGADAVILPGGFAHGDYLRTGAIARFSPVMESVAGLCRGRRPGRRLLQRLPDAARGRAARRRDAAQPSLQYRCEHVHVRVERTDTPLTALCEPGQRDAHPDRARRGQLLRRRPRSSIGSRRTARSIFRYVDAARRDHRRRQPERLARTTSPASATSARNVVGLMPHPERACEPVLGSGDGQVVLESVVATLRTGVPLAAEPMSAWPSGPISAHRRPRARRLGRL